MGLLISNQLADLLNKSEGGISVSSKLKQGSEFSFNIYDMKNDEDDEISISSRRVSNVSSTPCKLNNNTNEGIQIKENFELNSSTFFSNPLLESESINKYSDMYRIDMPIDNCIEMGNTKKQNKTTENAIDNNSSNIKRVDNIFMKTENQIKSYQSASSQNKDQNIFMKTNNTFRSRQKEKSVTAFEKHSINTNIEEENSIFARENSKNRLKEKAATAIGDISLMKKRIEKIKNRIEKKGCACPVALIIDDNDFNILSLKTHLKKFSMSCESALSGEIALQKIFKIHENDCCKYFKYIFLDLEMPVKNGLVIYKEISDYYQSFRLVDSMIILNTGIQIQVILLKMLFPKE